MTFDPAEARTQQSFKDECDPNKIMERFVHTGTMPLPTIEPRYGNIIGVDMHDLLNQVADAEEAFEALPAKLRDRFSNDPQAFVEFVLDPDNLDELVKMGLAEKKPARQGEAPLQGGQEPTRAPGATSAPTATPPKNVAPDQTGTTQHS